MLNITISSGCDELGKAAAEFISGKLGEAIRKKGEARLILSTGSSQFETLRELVRSETDWTKVEVFHLDEYVGLPAAHPAGFRKYLYDRFVSAVNLKMFNEIRVEDDIQSEIEELTEKIRLKPVDVGVIGIGVNGHIAFNDPPADFDTREAFRIVRLDPVCRKQQVDEGWFASVDEVPEEAVSMTVFQIMQCNTIVSCVPHKVKADAIYKTLSEKVTNLIPAGILKRHGDFHLFLDRESASRIVTV